MEATETTTRSPATDVERFADVVFNATVEVFTEQMGRPPTRREAVEVMGSVNRRMFG